MSKHLGKLILILAIFSLGVCFFYFDLGQHLTIDSLKANRQSVQMSYQENPFKIIAAFMGFYILVAGLSLPGAALLTVAGGALFGIFAGTIMVSLSSTIGASLAFLTSRYLMGNSIQEKFGDKLAAMNQGIEKEGAFYLFTVRLIPAFPFFVVNLVMGLTPIKTSIFFLVSMAGMLPGTIVYINAGTQLAELNNLGDILSLKLIASFALLGIFPILAKKILSHFRK